MNNRLNSSYLREFISLLMNAPIKWDDEIEVGLVNPSQLTDNLLFPLSLACLAYYDFHHTHYMEKAAAFTKSRFSFWQIDANDNQKTHSKEENFVDENKPFLFHYS